MVGDTNANSSKVVIIKMFEIRIFRENERKFAGDIFIDEWFGGVWYDSIFFDSLLRFGY